MQHNKKKITKKIKKASPIEDSEVKKKFEK